MTGTPALNRPCELYPQCHLLRPDLFKAGVAYVGIFDLNMDFKEGGCQADYSCKSALSQQWGDDPEKRAWVESKIKLGRVGAVQDIMGAVVYLASDASSLVTGSALLIDGGWTAG